MKIITPESMKAAYEFIRRVSFSGLKLPSSKRIQFKARRLKMLHGYYLYPDNIIVINAETPDISRMLQIMAHEMVHVALEQNASCDHDQHDEHFRALADVIEDEMGWQRGSI